jgi:exodeoxyribonuclease-3
VVLLGDYNVIPQAEDAAKPAAWVTDALFLPESRAAFRRLLNLGFTDALLARNPNPGYTFWDYQAGAWERNNGIRIDHVLLSPQAADLLADAGIEKSLRGGEKPSDHVPVWVELAA